MFTFGREHEIKHAVQRHTKEGELQIVVDIINAIHDFKEGVVSIETVIKFVSKGLTEGGAGTWEASGSWLCKLNHAYPVTECAWIELASHSAAAVRLRVACHLIDMPEPLATRLHSVLVQDRSARVRAHAEENWDYRQHPEKYS